MPPLTDLIPPEGDEEGAASDDDIIVGGVTQDFKCPLTATLLVDPVRNKLCKHAYSREAILQHVHGERRHRREATCPAAACSAVVLERKLQDAPDLARRVQRYVRQLERREGQRRDARAGTQAILE